MVIDLLSLNLTTFLRTYLTTLKKSEENYISNITAKKVRF